MITNQRIFFSDDGTLVDVSTALNDHREGTSVVPFVALEDYIYIGSHLPFNHKWFEMSTANDQGSAMTVDIWFHDQWEPAVDVIDDTVSGGASLGKSGLVRWVTNREKGWERETDSFDVSGLTSTEIYDMYWVRLGWSADWNVATEISYVGQKFANDIDLYSWYPDLNQSNLKVAFKAGKTNWDEQHFTAAQAVISDLRRQNIVWTGDQVIEPDLLQDAAIHKTAEIIFGALGEAYKDDLAMARNRYKEAINMKYFHTDKNKNANLDRFERRIQTSLRR